MDGFISFYDKEGSKIWTYVDQFNDILARKAKERFIKEKLVKNGKETLVFLIHEKKFNYFTENYTKK